MSKEAIMNTYGRKDVFFNKGKGTYLYDENGEKYLDFVMGVASNTLGHCNEEISNTIKEQSTSLIQVSNLYWNYPQTKLGQKIVSESGMEAVFFSNSGTESVECALKIALKNGVSKHLGKNKIICLTNSFHGRTMGSLKVTNEKYQKGYSIDSSNIICIDFNDVDKLEKSFDENVCGVIVEPIQGEGGIVTCSSEFMNKAKELCEEYQALLILDEVQCGMGRTGDYFAFQKYGITPDLLCLAKGLGGGIPIGATVVSKKYKDVLKPGDHGSTFGGNPLSCSVGLKVFEQIDKLNILFNVTSMNQYIFSKYENMKRKFSMGDLKGKGLLIGFDPGVENKKVVDKLFEKKVLVVGAGNNVVRILPPLNVKKTDIDYFFDKLEEALKEIYKC